MNQQTHRVELLAPAGSQEALEAAVRCGANAVYLGVGPFHARQNAKNFALDELDEICAFCHARGVAVHLTMNTLLQQDELMQAGEIVSLACRAGVDAVIVQDLGLARLIRQAAPDLKLHASTQCSVHTPEGVRQMASLGFHRVILAREMTREELREVCQAAREIGVEVEAFVHGAQCMSVSGQCRMSAMLGGRSANRGQCAQPCRLPFRALGGTGFDLSLQDLSLLTHVRELAEMGIHSLKIEGRMKRPEYVAAAVHAYRSALDGMLPDDAEQDRLKTVFSRGGLTSAYYEDARGCGMFGRRTGEDSKAAKETYAPLHELYRLERQSVEVSLTLTVEGDTLCLEASDREGNLGRAELPLEETDLSPVAPERLQSQLQKSGGTPFWIGSVVLPEKEIRVRLSAVNDLRRRALQGLYEDRAAPHSIAFQKALWAVEPISSAPRLGKIPLWARFGQVDQIPQDLSLLQGLEMIFLPAEWSEEVFSRLQKAGLTVGMDLPRGFFGREKSLVARMERMASLGVTRVLAHNLASVSAAHRLGLSVYGGDGLNLGNSSAVENAFSIGMTDGVIHPECTLSDAKAVGSGGLILYGRLPLMLTRNCPIANGGTCRKQGGSCRGQGVLTDRKGIDFPVVCRAGCSEVLNSRSIWMADRLREAEFASFGLLWFTVESGEEVHRVLQAYEQGGSPPEEYTRGLYYRGSRQAR